MERYEVWNSCIDEKCSMAMLNRLKNHKTDVYPYQEVYLSTECLTF